MGLSCDDVHSASSLSWVRGEVDGGRAHSTSPSREDDAHGPLRFFASSRRHTKFKGTQARDQGSSALLEEGRSVLWNCEDNPEVAGRSGTEGGDQALLTRTVQERVCGPVDTGEMGYVDDTGSGFEGGRGVSGDSPARAARIGWVDRVSPARSEERGGSAVTGIGISAPKKDIDNVHPFQGGIYPKH
jgi:hypothetical protein